ncbi:hypothetical protein G7A68_01785 [Shewanella baltica]|nr:hypothetical protein [Shewanella baltica]
MLSRYLCFNMQQITQKLAKANSTADVTFDDMDVIVEPPWKASRRVTEAVEFGERVMDKRFVLSL